VPPRIRKTKASSTKRATTQSAEVATTTTTASTTAPAPQTSASSTQLVLLDMPPADANIPSPPSGFVPGNSADYRPVLPRDAELRALPIAVNDMKKFTNYTQVLGDTAPPYEQVLQAITVANAWSSMRTESAAWDAFCASQEGISWTTLRAQMDRLQPSFDLAANGTSNVRTLFPGLSTLLGARKVIARKGASTRKMNKEAEAKGEPQVHGAVGKKRKRAAEKAAYAAAVGAGTAAPAGAATGSAGAASAAPTGSAGQPVTTTAAPVATATPAQPVATATPVGSAASAGTNGAPH
jgi:hypothetical protein